MKPLDQQQLDSLAYLRSVLHVNSTVYTVLRHRSPSGMTRHISCVIPHDGGILDISWHVAKALGWPVNVGKHDGIRTGGCGMDMGFHLVYSLARRLWPDGHPCAGEGCTSNDHVNGDRDYTVGKTHKDGGYALSQKWL